MDMTSIRSVRGRPALRQGSACQEPVRPRAASARHMRSGYSLIEVLIAVTIIALLAALIAPRLFGQLDASQVTAARTQIRMIETALDSFRLDIGRYPTEEEGLAVLDAPPPELAARWNGPYLDGGLPRDPWGNAFQYRPHESTARRGVVFSYGADGQPGGEGNNADIYARGSGPDDASAGGS